MKALSPSHLLMYNTVSACVVVIGVLVVTGKPETVTESTGLNPYIPLVPLFQ